MTFTITNSALKQLTKTTYASYDSLYFKQNIKTVQDWAVIISEQAIRWNINRDTQYNRFCNYNSMTETVSTGSMFKPKSVQCISNNDDNQ